MGRGEAEQGSRWKVGQCRRRMMFGGKGWKHNREGSPVIGKLGRGREKQPVGCPSCHVQGYADLPGHTGEAPMSLSHALKALALEIKAQSLWEMARAYIYQIFK